MTSSNWNEGKFGRKSMVVALVLGAATLSGCTNSPTGGPLSKLSASWKKAQAERKSQQPKQVQVAAAELPQDAATQAAQAGGINDATLANLLPYDQTSTGSISPSSPQIGEGKTKVERIANTLSASCRRVLAEAGIETTILRSPEVNGSINDEKDVNLGASYDILDLRRANLKEELALVQCARDDAAAKLAQLLVTSDQSLSQAGHRARADHYAKNAGQIAAIKAAIEQGLEEGNLTVFRADALRQSVRQIEAEATRSNGEAEKRQVVRNIHGQQTANLDSQLEKAEARIQEIEAKLRSADGVKLRASIGYAQRGNGSDDITIDDDGEFTAKFAVSVRLGAYSPRRFELEDIAANARTAALHEPNRGPLWRSQEAARVNRKFVGSLQEQRAHTRSALQAARRSAGTGGLSASSDVLAAQLKARIDVVRLGAELAALEATFADTGRLDSKLSFRR